MGLKYFQKIARKNRIRRRWVNLYKSAENARLVELARSKIKFQLVDIDMADISAANRPWYIKALEFIKSVLKSFRPIEDTAIRID